MSRHWKPEGKIVRIRPAGGRRNWARMHGYWQDTAQRRRLPAGAAAGLVLVAAACVGVAVGLYGALGPRDVQFSGAETAAPVEVVVPEVEVDPAHAEWAARGEQQGWAPDQVRGTSAAAGFRASFGSCHSGGGTNCVVDGDTFYIGGQKVRIAGIDAPETHDYRCASELALGNRASAQLQALLNSGAVTMTGIGRNRDAYARLLRNVAVDGTDVGEALIAAGVARAYGGGRRSWC